jgi:hypothetical protein
MSELRLHGSAHTVPMSVKRGAGSRMWVDTAALQ